ncbi:CU044_2847 family protein [Streptomyces sp. NPDC059009]|uniref:CU044_2847 family protein n=1 Tax=Streptomyces sp. NPDC059009 TaxID=3346694 RepID=UPI0036982891
MAGHVQRIELPGGQIVYARVSTGTGAGEDDEDVGVLETAVAKVEELGELIRRVGGSVLDAASAVAPDEASITFGVELSAKSGKVLAVLAEGEAKASVQVQLTWQFDREARNDGTGGTGGTGGTHGTGNTGNTDGTGSTGGSGAPGTGGPHA